MLTSSKELKKKKVEYGKAQTAIIPRKLSHQHPEFFFPGISLEMKFPRSGSAIKLNLLKTNISPSKKWKTFS
jgi:hypothetical protein